MALEVGLEISGGGLRELQFVFDEAAGTDLRFDVLPLQLNVGNGIAYVPVRLIEQQFSDPNNGQRTLTVKLDRHLVGAATLRGMLQIPRDVQGQRVAVPNWSLANAEQQSGYLAVEAANDQRVEMNALTSDDVPLRSVDPIDFPAAMYQPSERIVAAYQHVRPDWQLSIAEQRFDRVAVPTAVGHQSHVTSVVSPTGEMQHALELSFSAIGVQSLLMQLPERAELWSTLLDGQPVEVRRTPQGYQVPLLSRGAVEQQRTLSVVYQTAGAPLSQTGELVSQPPVFSVLSGSGEPQSLEILQQTWDLKTPRSTVLLGSRGLFEPTTRLDRGVLFGTLEDLIQLPSADRLSTMGLALAVVMVLLLGLRMLLVRVRPTWRIPVLALLVLIVPLLGLFSLMVSGLGTVRVSREFASESEPAAGNVDFHGGADLYWGDQPVPFDTASEFEGAEVPLEEMDMVGADDATLAASPVPSVIPPHQPGINDLRLGRQPAAPMSESAPVPQMTGESVQDEFHARNRFSRGTIGQPNQPFGGGGFGGGGVGGFGGSQGVAGPGPGVMNQRNGDGANQQPESGPMQQAGQGLNGSVPAVDFSPAFDAPQAGGDVQRFDQMLQLEISQTQGEWSDNDANGRFDSTWGSTTGGALLSMTVQLPEPANMRTHRFVYGGSGTNGTVRLRYADQQACQMLLMCIALGVMLCGWWCLRTASWMLRSVWVLVTIALPWALAPILPITGQLLMEAVFCGGLLTALLWLLHGIVVYLPGSCCRCCTWCSQHCIPTWLKAKFAPLMLGALLGLAATAHAEEAAQPQAPPVPQQDPYVIIPYATDQDPLLAKRVFVPHNLHRKLWLAAHPENRPAGPDVPARVVEALYSAEVTGTDANARAVVQARLTIVKSRSETEQVALPLRSVVIRSAQLDGTIAAVQAGEGLMVPVADVGVHTLDLTFELPVRWTGPAGEFTFTVQPTPAASLIFTVPDGMTVSGSETYRKLTSDDGVTRILAPVNQGGHVRVGWQPDSQRNMVQGTIAVETAVAVLVNDAGLSVNHAFHVTPRQSAINELAFSITPGAVVRRIAGDDVGGWELDEAGTNLKLFFREPLERPTEITIDLFQNLSLDEGTKSVAIPQIAPLDVTTETGLIGVFGGEQYTVRGGESTGVSQLDRAAFRPRVQPQGADEAPLLTYRFLLRPYEFALRLGRRPPQTKARAEHGVLVEQRRLRVASRFEFELTGAPSPSVTLQLPFNYLPIDVAAPLLSDWYLTERDDLRFLTIELTEPHLGTLPVVLEGRLSMEPEDEHVYVDFPFPVDIAQLETTLGIWLGAGESGVILDDDDWRSVDPTTLPASLRQLDPLPPQFGFRSMELEPPVIELDVMTSEPELQADAIVLLANTEATVEYGLTLRWKIARAATDRFQFTTPNWLSGRLEIQAPGLRQVTEEPLPNGDILWTVTLVDPIQQQYLLTAAATIPAPQDNRILTPVIQFQQGNADSLTRLEFQRQYAILVNLSTSQLVPANPNEIDSVARDELPLVVSPQLVQQAMEIARVRPQRVPLWNVQRVESQQAASATVIASDLVTVVEPDGSWRTRAAYSMRNRGRQFLGLTFPEGSRLLSVLVGGTPSRAVTTTLQGQPIHLIALPQTSEADLSFEIRVVLAGEFQAPLPSGFDVNPREFQVPAPQVVSPRDSQEYGLSVAQTAWNVYFPEGFLVAPVDDLSRSNLNWYQGEQGWLTSELNRMAALKADAMEMIRIMKDSRISQSRRSYAKDNLKQIGLALHNYNDYYDRESGELSQQLAVENNELLEKVQSNLDDIASFQTDQDEDGDGIAAGGQWGRRYILNNNDFNFANNGLGIQDFEQQQAKAGFNYRDQGYADFAGEAKKESTSRAGLKSQLQGQGAIRGNTLGVEVHNGTMVLSDGLSLDANSIIGNAESSYQIAFPQAQQPASTASPQTSVGFVIGESGVTSPPQRPSAWSGVGGLSLELDVPIHGDQFSFSKVGGDPRLAFTVQPRELRRTMKGTAWTLVWIAVGLWACHWLARLTSLRMVIRVLAGIGCCAGLLGAFVLGSGLAWPSFVLFVGSAVVLLLSDPAVAPVAKELADRDAPPRRQRSNLHP
ncbi:MAG: hypothetical protein KDA58_09150 [Planctomycetaceae bacterium]|nr:hypothetical protein [Planctomycetaceae bacterium]